MKNEVTVITVNTEEDFSWLLRIAQEFFNER